MRIAYVINGLNGGGAALPMPDVIGVLRDAGHQVRVVALSIQDGRAVPALQRARIEHRILGHAPVGLRSLPALALDLRRDRPDLIWTSLAATTILGQLCGRLLGIPVVSWQHNAWLKPGNRIILKQTRRWTRLWIADSEAVRVFAVDSLGIAPERLTVWPLFVAEPDVPLASPWQPPHPFVIGSLGRLHPNKRHDLLLRAVARLRDLDPAAARTVEVRIAGSGEELASLRALAAELALDPVRFEGFVSNPRAFLAGLHAFVQPSHHEGLCLAAHEAMQAGVAVIATSVGQLPYTIDHGRTGFLVDVGDVEAIAATLLDLVRHPERAALVGTAAREHVLQRFDRARFESTGRQILHRIETEVVASTWTRRAPC